jgi:hypothetical protein
VVSELSKKGYGCDGWMMIVLFDREMKLRTSFLLEVLE